MQVTTVRSIAAVHGSICSASFHKAAPIRNPSSGSTSSRPFKKFYARSNRTIFFHRRCRRFGNHPHESLLRFERRHDQTQQEAVPQRLQSLVVSRQFIRGGDDAFERKQHFAVAVAEKLFVQHGKQRILNRGAGLPDFVEEDDVGRGKVAVGKALVCVAVLELGDGHGTENLVGRAEAAHQILECAGVAERQFEPSGDEALADARQSEQEETFARHGAQQRQGQHVVAFVDSGPHLFEELADAVHPQIRLRFRWHK